MKDKIKIGGLQKLTLLDYPGKTACTVFLSGCNFRCPFCHNASLVLTEKITEGFEEEELFQFLKKRQGLLEGVCVTGGEPLLQPGLSSFLKRIKGLGYEIKLDTNGSFPKRLSELVEMGLVDYVAMDIKNSLCHYGRAIGKEELFAEKAKIAVCLDTKEEGNALSRIKQEVKESVRFLLQGKVDYEFRTTVVKGIHTIEDMEEIGKWIQGAKRYYIQNFLDSGNLIHNSVRFGSDTMEPFTKEEIKKLLNAVKPRVPGSLIRGE